MKKAFISGKFNVLHPGHIRLFRFAKEQAFHLLVGVIPDSQCSGKFVAQELRLDGLKNISIIDECFILDTTVAEYIQNNKPDFIIKGVEHESTFNLEQEIVESYGGKLLFCSSELIYSSNNEYFHSPHEIKLTAPPPAYISRHSIDYKNLAKAVSNFKSLNVLVIGDLIVDEYVYCKPVGMSREDSSIVSIPIESKKFIGGAGIVAAHAASLGANCTFLSIYGNDENANFAKDQLQKYNVKNYCITDDSRPTTHKIRYKNNESTLFRLSHFHESKINPELTSNLIKIIEQSIDNYQLIVFSDFNYGVITPTLREYVTAKAIQSNIFLVADSQSSSQFGDISCYKTCDLIFATEYEARLSLFDKDSGLIALVNKLQAKTQAKNIVLKIGAEGILIRSDQQIDSCRDDEMIMDDQLPAFNKNAIDVSGAGDSMLITSSMCMALGLGIWESTLMGSIAAGIQVGRAGNIPLMRSDFTGLIS